MPQLIDLYLKCQETHAPRQGCIITFSSHSWTFLWLSKPSNGGYFSAFKNNFDSLKTLRNISNPGKAGVACFSSMSKGICRQGFKKVNTVASGIKAPTIFVFDGQMAAILAFWPYLKGTSVYKPCNHIIFLRQLLTWKRFFYLKKQVLLKLFHRIYINKMALWSTRHIVNNPK